MPCERQLIVNWAYPNTLITLANKGTPRIAPLWRNPGEPMKQLDNIKHIAYLKLGQHRGTRRLWMQGQKLEDAGFEPGSRYRITRDPDSNTLNIEITEDGARTVSKKRVGKKEIPVVDINNKVLAEMFNKSVERVCAVVTDKSIIIAIHPDDEAAAERYGRLIAKLHNNEPLAIGSVSHGGGIMDNALHQGLASSGVDARLAYAVEIEHKYLEASLRNNEVWDERSISVCAPMEEVDPRLLPKIDIYAGGIPCTGDSRSGKAKNKIAHAEEHESAGALFLAFLTIMKQGNPSVVVLENVPDYRHTQSMTVIRSALKQLKYQVHETILDGAEHGALEARKRFCMVAVTEGLEFNWERLRPIRKKEARLGDVLDAIEDTDGMWRTYAYLDKKATRDKAAGKGFKQQLVTPDSTSVGTIGRGYQKGRSTEPFLASPTDPGKKRLLTPKEHARVKTIPEHLVEGLSNTIAHEILGQSVIHSAFVATGILIGNTLLDAYDDMDASDASKLTGREVPEIVMEFGEPEKPRKRRAPH